MCGRFARSSGTEVIVREFGVKKTLVDLSPEYNIAPSRDIVTVTDRGERLLVTCRWGFVPAWSKDASSGYKMINARAETVAEKPAFRKAFLNSRCLVVADGFFEWKKSGTLKMPYYIRLRSGRPFGLAGLHNTWTSPDGEDICTCTIITTTANELLAEVHDRMPVIIPKGKMGLWLDSGLRDRDVLRTLLLPYPAEEMVMYPVSLSVNSPAYASSEAIQRVER